MSDPDEHARNVAKVLLDALDADENPNDAALEAQKDRRQGEIAGASHIRDGKAKPAPRPTFHGPARSLAEMQFAAGLEECPHCGSRRTNDLALHDAGGRWELRGTCGYCKKPRTFTYASAGDPASVSPRGHELGDGPSQMISAAQFRDELAWLEPIIAPVPSRLQPVAWRTSARANERALTCLAELRKLAAPGVDRAWLDAEWQRHLELAAKHDAERERNHALLAAKGML